MSNEEKNGVDMNNNDLDAKTFEEMEEYYKNLTTDDLKRGTTPDDIKKKCLDLCKKYIGGTWDTVNEEDIEVNRISGGLTNQLYYVGLKDTVQQIPEPVVVDEPREVTIKMYLAKHFKNKSETNERLNDTIISTIVSEINIGPKLYGVFENGVVQAYYTHEQFRIKHQRNDKLLRKLAHILARIHSLNVPILKNKYNILEQLMDSIIQTYKQNNVKQIFQELNLETLIQNDLLEECEEFERMMKSEKSPTVFCHNDFRGSNMLVTGDETGEQSIVMCDFEYCSYGPRGYDFASFLTEWGKELFDTEFLDIPSDEVIEHFVKFYIEESELITPGYTDNPKNSLEKIVKEVKLNILFNFMFILCFIVKQKDSVIESVPFNMKFQMMYVEKFFIRYLKLKKQLIEENIYKVPEKIK